jgi:hypothetical protein
MRDRFEAGHVLRLASANFAMRMISDPNNRRTRHFDGWLSRLVVELQTSSYDIVVMTLVTRPVSVHTYVCAPIAVCAHPSGLHRW